MVCETTVEEIPDRILVLRRKNPHIFILQPGACGRSPVPHTGGVTTTTTTTTTTTPTPTPTTTTTTPTPTPTTTTYLTTV